MTLDLPSGLAILDPTEIMLRFCEEEYAYYDAIPSHDPNAVEPIDVMVTVAMNSFIGDAATARRVHQGLAKACDPLLPGIPESADLVSFDSDLSRTSNLLEAACEAWGVWLPRATKVLHRKRRRLIPMLDTVVIEHYLAAHGQRRLASSQQALEWFREDLLAVKSQIESIEHELHKIGYVMSPVRILEVLVWTAVEPRGYYRQPSQSDAT